MKKLSLVAIQTLLTDLINDDPTNEAEYGDILAEVTAELNKGAEQKAQNDALYEEAKTIVMDELGKATEAVTIGELYDAVAGNLPEGFTKGKLQYAVTRLWKDEIVRIEGKVNSYRKA